MVGFTDLEQQRAQQDCWSAIITHSLTISFQRLSELQNISSQQWLDVAL